MIDRFPQIERIVKRVEFIKRLSFVVFPAAAALICADAVFRFWGVFAIRDLLTLLLMGAGFYLLYFAIMLVVLVTDLTR